MNQRTAQHGLTLIGWLVIVLVIGVTATLAVRLLPHYIENRTLVSIVNALPAERVHAMPLAEIQDALERRFVVNNIRDKRVADVIKVDRRRDGTALMLAYEVREPLVMNVDLVLRFDRQFEFQ
jgi:Tfp pilus assembly protein PilE